MTEADVFADTRSIPRVGAGRAFSIWARHLASLAIPLTTLLFLWTGPHRWYVAPIFMVPLGFILFIDQKSPPEKSQPLEALPAWPFDLLVYMLAGLQFLIVFELSRMFSHQSM